MCSHRVPKGHADDHQLHSAVQNAKDKRVLDRGPHLAQHNRNKQSQVSKETYFRGKRDLLYADFCELAWLNTIETSSQVSKETLL